MPETQSGGAKQTSVSEKSLGSGTVRVEKGDITLLEVDAFVFYASHDLKLGTGIGGAISVRGGPAIQEELDRIGKLETTRSVATGAGDLKARYIIHSVGPRFQEPETEHRLAATMQSSLELAREKELERIAFPAMGCGFYGVPLDVSARVMFEAFEQHLGGPTTVKEITVCVIDNRELKPFAERLEIVAQKGART